MPEAPRTPLQKAIRKRANALRSIATCERAIQRLRARIAELDAEIAGYGGRKHPLYARRLPFRANGQMERAVYDLARERGEFTSADLAARMMAHFGVDTSDAAAAWAMRQRAAQAIRRCASKGTLVHVGGAGKGGEFKRWALAIRD
jgi:hypothetical protein